MDKIWRGLMHFGMAHGVNPLIFAVLYLLHHPLFWGTIAWLVARLRRRRPIHLQIALAVFFWLMPYLYLFFFSRHLPWWAYMLVIICLAIGLPRLWREINKKLSPYDKEIPIAKAKNPKVF